MKKNLRITKRNTRMKKETKEVKLLKNTLSKLEKRQQELLPFGGGRFIVCTAKIKLLRSMLATLAKMTILFLCFCSITQAQDVPKAYSCDPLCREGFICVVDQCVPACNPACATVETCTWAGLCEKAETEEPRETKETKQANTVVVQEWWYQPSYYPTWYWPYHAHHRWGGHGWENYHHKNNRGVRKHK